MPERWEQVESLFAAALAVPEAQRAAFLASRSSGDPALAAEVESLLAADLAAGTFLGELESALGSEPQDELRGGEPQCGDRIGRYELVRELGRGGSGVVFLARRLDRRDGPEVALKMLHACSSCGPRGRVAERRFRTEWRILASLEHPNLARLLDVGATGSGAPYFVMEHVEGVALDRYCDQARLPIEARLRLFVTVCETVEAAHRRRIVHRDLKPANILVTAAGTPKLLDFGIAKLLDPEPLTQQETTGTWMRVLTPQYASPEQVLGQAISPASDVYSLGVLLYRLLTGRLPLSVPAGPLDEVARLLGESVPPRPSAAVLPERGRGGEEAAKVAALRGLSPAALSRRLRGDLDAIVARALAKEPGRRYPSAGDLAIDVRNHLAGAAVAARPPRLLVLSRSHSVRQAAAAALLLCSLGLGAATSLDLGPPRLDGGPRAGGPTGSAAARSCIPDGGVDDTLLSTDCCSGVAVSGSTVCEETTDWGTSWSSCKQVCGTRPVTCIPPGGVDDTLALTDCCTGAAVPGSTQCLDPADFGTTWRTCVQVCA